MLTFTFLLSSVQANGDRTIKFKSDENNWLLIYSRQRANGRGNWENVPKSVGRIK